MLFDLAQEPYNGYDPLPFTTLYCDLCGREIEEDEEFAREHGRNQRVLCMRCAGDWMTEAARAEEDGEETDGWLELETA